MYNPLDSSGANFTRVIASWVEQRNYTYFAIDALGDHEVVADIKRELDALRSHEPNLDGLITTFTFKFALTCLNKDAFCSGFHAVNPGQTFSCTGFTYLGFSLEGGLSKLVYKVCTMLLNLWR